MSEYASLLERQMERIPSPSFTADDLLERRARRQRNQRVASGALGLALVALLLLVLGRGLGALRREPLPASPPITPSNVFNLKVSWTGALDTGPATSATATGDTVYVGNGRNVRAYSTACGSGGTRCAPRWVGTVEGQIDNDVTEVGGVVYVGSDSLTAFPASCDTDPATCRSLWTTLPIGGGHAISTPVVSNGIVYVGTGDGELYAFSASCRGDGGICRPLWVGRTGTSRSLSAPAVSGDTIYVTSDRLYAFPMTCADRSCAPSWSGILSKQAFEPPAVADGIVYVGGDVLYAFPTRCPEKSCPADWTWQPPGGAAISSVRASAKAVFVVADRLYALPPDCGAVGECEPTWTSPTHSFSRPTIADGLVFVTTDRVWAFRISCAADDRVCTPVWVSPAIGSGIPLSAPTVTPNAVYVTSSGELTVLAIPAP